MANYRGLQLTGPDLASVHQFFGGRYEEAQITIFERLAAVSKLVIDVGANIGLYTCVGASRMPPDGRLIAFEPAPENLRHLAENLRMNDLAPRVTVEASAVGDRTGEVTIYLAPKIGHHSAAAANAHHSTHGITVPLTTLDSYTTSNNGEWPDVIKIDTEGYDGFALQGALRILREAKPTLFIEYAPLHLENCGFDRTDFLDLIFDNYSDVFLAHAGKMRPCTRHRVLDMVEPGLFHVDLLAVARPEHRRIVERYL